MMLFKKADDIRAHLNNEKKKKYKVGFVPTMGALHQGHISLVRTCIEENDLSICSIFINRSQFNDPNDFKKYPVTIEKDIEDLEKTGCDILFYPSEEEINTTPIQGVHYDLGFLETILEGVYRPGHFQGVCKAVHRLLEIILPDRLYLGQKDYQQIMVIKRLISLIRLDKKIKICIQPTIREPDGLAMSSRNMRLSEEDREKATAIYRALVWLKNNLGKISIPEMKRKVNELLVANDFKTDYVEIANAESLQLVDSWDGSRKLIALIAAVLNGVRLIDNMQLN